MKLLPKVRRSIIIEYLKKQCNKRKPADSFTQARVYLYDLYYHYVNFLHHFIQTKK